MPGAMDLGVADNRKRAGHELAAQIAIALLADTAKAVLASTGVLLRLTVDQPVRRSPNDPHSDITPHESILALPR
jgi:hypothetical protein